MRVLKCIAGCCKTLVRMLDVWACPKLLLARTLLHILSWLESVLIVSSVMSQQAHDV